MDSDQTYQASVRLKIFMVAIRVVGVILALILTGGNSKESLCTPFPYDFDDLPIIITFAVIVYNIAAAVFTCVWKDNQGGAPIILTVFDIILGLGLTYFYGPSYLILSFALPILFGAKLPSWWPVPFLALSFIF